MASNLKLLTPGMAESPGSLRTLSPGTWFMGPVLAPVPGSNDTTIYHVAIGISYREECVKRALRLSDRLLSLWFPLVLLSLCVAAYAGVAL